MPIYGLQCVRCGGRFEELLSSGARGASCPNCGSVDLWRLLSPVSPPGRSPRGAKVRDSEARRREREAARRERLDKPRKARKS